MAHMGLPHRGVYSGGDVSFIGTSCTPPIAPLGRIDFGLGSTPQGYNFRKAIPPLHYPMCQPHRGLISIELWGFTSLASKIGEHSLGLLLILREDLREPILHVGNVV